MPRQCFNDNLSQGKPLAGGLIYSCAAGSSCPGTFLATFTDSTGTLQNTNPVILDAAGCSSIWLTPGTAYKFVAQNAFGVQEWSADNVTGLAGSIGNGFASTTVVSFSATPTFNVISQNQLFQMTLTGNVTSSNLVVSGITPPAIISFEIAQDGTGSRTFTWPVTSFAAYPVSSTANSTTIETFLWDGSTALLLSAYYNVAGVGTQVANNLQAGTINNPTFPATTTFSAILANSIASRAANPAATGFVRMASGDTACWRNNANSGDICVSKNGADQIVTPNSLTTVSQATAFTSSTANPAAGGVVRLASADTACWRNAANSADICVSKNGSDQLLIPSALITSPTFVTGVNNNGSGHKHQRFGATCTTAATAGSSCTTTYTWATAFADANYTPTCTAIGAGNNPAGISIDSWTASQVVVRVFTIVNAASTYNTGVNCIADHD